MFSNKKEMFVAPTPLAATFAMVLGMVVLSGGIASADHKPGHGVGSGGEEIQAQIEIIEIEIDALESRVGGSETDIGDLIIDVGKLQDTSGPKIVFATSTTYTGNLGGLIGADQKCQAAATREFLPGTYLAWLSTYPGPAIGQPEVDPSDRFTRSAAPYTTPNGIKVADHYGDLVDGTLDNPIAEDEGGGTIFVGSTWSHTAANGRAISGSASTTCNNWTTDAFGTEARFLGNVNSTDFFWSAPGASIPEPCANSHRLYCVQQ